MLFSRDWLQEYYATELPKPEKLEGLLNLHAFEVESVSKKGKDSVLDVDVLPNRAHDCLSHIGIAREVAAIEGKKIKLPKTKAVKTQKGSLESLNVTIESSVLVPRYAGLAVEGITVGKSPKKVQHYLEAVGINSINNVIDLTNFIMLEMGQPLHAFDYDQIQGYKMNIRGARQGEKLETLDDQALSLPKGALIIEDQNRLIDLAGIKGGKVSGISNTTKNIFLQAANFQAQTIYQTKTQLKYATQAADIYAHEIDPNLGMRALERANQLLQEWGIGGKIVQVIDIYPKKVLPKRIALDIASAESLLGIPVSKAQAKKILRDLDCKVAERGNKLEVEVPTRRIDLSIPEDLVEEIGRIYGYENIPAEFPAAALIPPAQNLPVYWQDMARNSMKELGFTETYSYSFVGQKDFSQFGYTQDEKNKLAELENPMSGDFTHLRDSLLENLLKVVQKNQKKFDSMRVFEIGKVFQKKGTRFQETKMLGGVVLGEGFYAAKGIVDFLLQDLGIADVWYDDYKQTPQKSRATLWHKGKSAEVKVGNPPAGGEIGFVGEISPAIAANLKIAKPVGAFHINIEKLSQLAFKEKEYQALSKFPSVIRDIAILVPTQTKVVEIMNVMNIAGGQLVEDIDLFDMYEGGNLPEGKKNIAFHMVYQSYDKTLQSKEVDVLHNTIIKAIEKNPEWEVRK